MSSVYIIYSKKLNQYYIGATEQKVETRLEQHNTAFYGLKSFTARANDWKLKLVLKCVNQAHSLRLELKIKTMKSSVYIQNLMKYEEMRDKIIEETQ